MNAKLALTVRRLACAGCLISALGSAGCGSTNSSGGGAAEPDTTADVALGFGGKDVVLGADTAASGSDIVAVSDSGNVPGQDAAMADVMTTDDATVQPGDATGAADATAKDAAGDGALACEPLTSSGCSASQQCFYATPGVPQCVTPGTIAVGAACTSILSCVKGALCINGKCGTICDASGANASLGCADPAYCGGLIDQSGAPIGDNLGVCFGSDNCNPVTNSGCTGGDACDPGGSGTFCQAPGKVAVGGACLGTGGDDCAADSLCLGATATAAGVCQQRCDTTATSPCPTGKTCGGVTSNGVPVGNNFGVCG